MVRFIYAVLWVLWIQTMSAAVPTTEQLLNNYTRALDSTLSFTAEYEQKTEFSYYVSSGIRDQGTGFQRGLIRHDDQRFYDQVYYWGDYNLQLKDLPEDKPYYHCSIIDGRKKRVYHNNGHLDKPDSTGSVSRHPTSPKDKVTLGRVFGISYLMGYIGGDQRLDTILRKADHISVRENAESVSGSECFVIEADTAHGHYTVWLDPDHGFHPAKILREAKGGHYTHDRKMIKGETAFTYLKNVRFEKIDEIWIPVEADAGCDRRTPQGYFVKDDYHYKRTQITLNPDHDTLGSFADPIKENPANDPKLKNGTRIRLYKNPKEFIWQDGKLVPAEKKN